MSINSMGFNFVTYLSGEYTFAKDAFNQYGVISIELCRVVEDNNFGLKCLSSIDKVVCKHTKYKIDCSVLLYEYQSAYYQLSMFNVLKQISNDELDLCVDDTFDMNNMPNWYTENRTNTKYITEHYKRLKTKVDNLGKIIESASYTNEIDFWTSPYLFNYSLYKAGTTNRFKIVAYNKDLISIREFALGMDAIIRVVNYNVNKKALTNFRYQNRIIVYPYLTDAPAVFRRVLYDILKDIKTGRTAAVSRQMTFMADLIKDSIELSIGAYGRVVAKFKLGSEAEDKYKFYMGNTGGTYQAMGYKARMIAHGGYTI